MWNWSYAVEVVPALLRAFLMNAVAALTGFAFAAVIGLVIAVIGQSGSSPIKWAFRAIVEFIRNTPLLVQLFFLYYSLPMLTPFSLSAFMTGAIGIGIHYGTYLSEVYRSGIEAVPRGQWEAATALNLSRVHKWVRILLPQAIPPIIPIMGNYLIVILKETPTLSAITFVEVLLTAKNQASQSYRVFEPYTIAGILFLILSLLLSYAVARLEKRLNGRHT
ncbi:ectoine/hydroxyectoine ABC transporter permease subunit EhuD [Paenibacillus silvisoli]|uniref:ectoine/hydroxyectoine ABC transporter permease subunit EhuD n=1 Tax=Paenibacillus silvisoli TaxID=3110539 RepID=UPI002803BF1C|nr:ectoine/hydroxyectoine ABC transporter permease subunit EhuD [Paenibacillus silvisoli]